MTRSVRILLVEDNELDVRMILHSANKTKLRNNIKVVHDGSQAIEYLAACEDNMLPDLILLDLSLPGISGLEFLSIVKKEKRLSSVPVVILTSSSAEADIKKAYEEHAAAFITKPIEVDGFAEIVLAIDDFFFDIVSLPEA